MMGLKVGSGESADSLHLLEIVTNPDKHKKTVEELNSAIAGFVKAAGSKERLDSADGLLKQAKETKAAADAYLAKVKAQAEALKRSADEYSTEVRSEADSHKESVLNQIEKASREWDAKASKFKQREADISAKEKDVVKREAEADNKIIAATKIKTQYEHALEKLKKLSVSEILSGLE